MTLYHNLIDVASKQLKLPSFYYYPDVAHEAVECDKQVSCDFMLFWYLLKKFVSTEINALKNKENFLFDTVWSISFNVKKERRFK